MDCCIAKYLNKHCEHHIFCTYELLLPTLFSKPFYSKVKNSIANILYVLAGIEEMCRNYTSYQGMFQF